MICTSCGDPELLEDQPRLAHDRQLGGRCGEHPDDRRLLRHPAPPVIRPSRLGSPTLRGDVAPSCRALERDPRCRVVRARPRLGDRRAPPGDREHAAAGRDHSTVASRVPEWKTATSGDLAAPSSPSIGGRSRTDRGIRRSASTTVTAASSARSTFTSASRPVAHASRTLGQVRSQPRDHDLRLGVAEPAVVLEDLRALGGEHQARIEEPGYATPSSARARRPCAHDRPDPRFVRWLEPRQRRVGAHPAGVRPRSRRRSA